MPIPSSFHAEPPKKKVYPLLPEDTYQVFISDIKLERKMNIYADPPAEENFFTFTFQFLDAEYADRKIWKDVRPIISPGDGQYPASNLFVIYEAAMGKDMFQSQVTAVDGDLANALIGKQLRLIIKTKKNKKGVEGNRIDSYLKSKADVPLPLTWDKPVFTEPELPSVQEDEPIITEEDQDAAFANL